ncbi:hypothetical protein ABEB36_010937 [Hypothenemus hampei]|uniref:Dolichyl-diphosphooligosaccharide--protein glycosyltransferase subunit KCP2 n=1 Tax=Hypothenemus hampei TaxID=57062 RepID=A0ABD1EDK8_HYPHA
MGITTKTSLLLAIIGSILIISSLQTWKSWLSSSNPNTFLGGLLGSFLFTFALTAIGNFETLYFGKSFNLGLFPEVLLALFLAVAGAGSVHRVSGSSCFLLSLIALYYVNRHSHKVHGQIVAQPVIIGKKKRN